MTTSDASSVRTLATLETWPANGHGEAAEGRPTSVTGHQAEVVRSR